MLTAAVQEHAIWLGLDGSYACACGYRPSNPLSAGGYPRGYMSAGGYPRGYMQVWDHLIDATSNSTVMWVR